MLLRSPLVRHRAAVLYLTLMLGAVAACGRRETGYFPFAEGLYLQYAVTVRTVFLEHRSKYLVRTLGPREYDGREVFGRLINNDIAHFYAAEPDGIHRVATRRGAGTEAVVENERHLVLPAPLEIGATWRQRSTTRVLETVVDPFRRRYRLELPVDMTYRVERLGEAVRVPAGHFPACLEISASGRAEYRGDSAIRAAEVRVEQTDWYAPGVGLVKRYRRETTTNRNLPQGEFLMELEVLARD